MCGGDFMSKNLEEAMEFLNYVAEVSRGWDEPNAREVGRMKSQPNAKGGMYVLNEDIDMKAKVAAMARRLEELEMKKVQEMQAISETLVHAIPCSICQSYEHLVEECPTILAVREMFGDQANVIAIVNLSKVVGDQKSINAQLNQRMNSVESTLNKRMDGIQNDLSHKIDNVQYAISRLTNLNTVQEKGKFPSQPHPNPKGIHEVEAQEGESSKVREVKAVITLRSGKRKGKSTKKDDHEYSMDEEPKRIVIKEDMMKKHMPPPFPQALHGKKGTNNAPEIFEVLRQVKVNIPLLDMIKQVPTYAKFLKNLCTVKRGLNVNKKAFLTKQISAIIQCKSPMKYKDPGCPTTSVSIGGTCVEKALLDLGASVNFLLYSVYKQLGLGELKPTSLTLSLADRSMKITRGMIEDVLVQVEKFYYPMDFVVLDTDPVVKGTNYVSIILGRPFLATSNAIINCRNGVMQLMFGNMTLELNIFHLYKKHIHPEEEEGLPEPSNLLATLSPWRRREEIIPLFNKEETQRAAKEESPKLILKPLPTELKYAYLDEDKKCPVVISSALTIHKEDCLLEVLRRYKKGVENLVADHLSRLAIAHNSHGLPINDDFPEKSLMLVEVAPWYAHIANYLVIGEVPSEWKAQDKKHFFAKIHAYYWEEPFLFK
ncbi:hypothetical protein CK203_061164 [Vitis vinifera]|uniref:Reverse transcriptase/retrotransposon-derived protein RNase H-like domain-containing protein n=1 Tax=Vitis vinifera TaxID=29760 RepID=A0A438GC72_VITVI|nr:hypothetical protein CK203_061164 [Vitis vinifera]